MSSNVGIDFTEIRPPPWQGPRRVWHESHQRGYGVVGEKQEDLITIGFRVKLKEKAIIQDYVNRMYNHS